MDLAQLERAWKKDRPEDVERILFEAYMERFLATDPERGIEPSKRDLVELQRMARTYAEKQLKRLAEEVELDVRREQIEELACEHGNLEKRPWIVNVLTEEASYETRRPDYVTPDGVDLWIANWGIHGTGKNAKRHFVLEGAPDWLQRDLEREYGAAAEFITVYAGGDNEYLADTDGENGRPNPGLWQRVHASMLGERECPYATWDPDTREEAQSRRVTESDTWFGEDPGKSCRLCGSVLGAFHGHIYLGEETDEVVYVKLQPLASVNPDTDEYEIRRAFSRSGYASNVTDDVDVFYEHGQWWVRVEDAEGGQRTYSVVDEEVNGGQFQLGFEEI